MYKCYTCNYVCEKLYSFNRHKESNKHKINIEKELKCSECDKVLSSKQNLLNHLKKKHQILEVQLDNTFNKIKKLEKKFDKEINKLKDDVNDIKEKANLFCNELLKHCYIMCPKSKPIYQLESINFLKYDEIKLKDTDEELNNKIVTKIIKYKKKNRLAEKIVNIIIKKYKIKTEYSPIWSFNNLENEIDFLLKVKNEEGIEEWIIDSKNEIFIGHIHRFINNHIKTAILLYTQDNTINIFDKIIENQDNIQNEINNVIEMRKHIKLCKEILIDIENGTLQEYVINEICKECNVDKKMGKYINNLKNKIIEPIEYNIEEITE